MICGTLRASHSLAITAEDPARKKRRFSISIGIDYYLQVLLEKRFDAKSKMMLCEKILFMPKNT